MTRYTLFVLTLFVLTACGAAPAATVVPSATPVPTATPMSAPTATPTLPPTPTLDPKDAIRAEQAVRDIVIPNTAEITTKVNSDIASVVLYFHAAQLYWLKYELMDWVTEGIDATQYTVYVSVQVLEECAGLQQACDEEKELVDFISDNPGIKGCEIPAEFLVLLGDSVTVVPKNACAESLYY